MINPAILHIMKRYKKHFKVVMIFIFLGILAFCYIALSKFDFDFQNSTGKPVYKTLDTANNTLKIKGNETYLVPGAPIKITVDRNSPVIAINVNNSSNNLLIYNKITFQTDEGQFLLKKQECESKAASYSDMDETYTETCKAVIAVLSKERVNLAKNNSVKKTIKALPPIQDTAAHNSIIVNEDPLLYFREPYIKVLKSYSSSPHYDQSQQVVFAFITNYGSFEIPYTQVELFNEVPKEVKTNYSTIYFQPQKNKTEGDSNEITNGGFDYLINFDLNQTINTTRPYILNIED
jgi:hypothetical protein